MAGIVCEGMGRLLAPLGGHSDGEGREVGETVDVADNGGELALERFGEVGRAPELAIQAPRELELGERRAHGGNVLGAVRDDLDALVGGEGRGRASDRRDGYGCAIARRVGEEVCVSSRFSPRNSLLTRPMDAFLPPLPVDFMLPGPGVSLSLEQPHLTDTYGSARGWRR